MNHTNETSHFWKKERDRVLARAEVAERRLVELLQPGTVIFTPTGEKPNVGDWVCLRDDWWHEVSQSDVHAPSFQDRIAYRCTVIQEGKGDGT